MTRKKTKQVALEVVPERPRFIPEWAARRAYDGHVHSSYVTPRQIIEGLREGRFRFPKFQRPYVWSDEQVLFLLDSMRRGYHTGELLLWQHSTTTAVVESFNDVRLDCPAMSGVHPSLFVIDGQQRLGAIASAALSGRFVINLLDGSIGINVAGPWQVPMGLVLGWASIDFFDWSDAHCAEHRLDNRDVLSAFASATEIFGRARIGYVELPAEWPLDRVLESYRRLNTCGTPMDPRHLADGLKRALCGDV